MCFLQPAWGSAFQKKKEEKKKDKNNLLRKINFNSASQICLSMNQALSDLSETNKEGTNYAGGPQRAAVDLWTAGEV